MIKKITLFGILLFCLALVATAQNKQTSNEKSVVESLTVETFKQKVMDYSDGNYNWNYVGELPCIIDFSADWCRPCRMLFPILEEMATKYSKKIVIYKIDTEKQKELAGLFRISSIPVLLFVPKGNKQPTMLKGYRDANQLENEIKKYLLTE